MKHALNKIFNLSDIRYGWLLLISMGIFIASLYYGKMTPQITPTVEWMTYGSAFILAVVWGIFNYIDHIKVNANFKKYDHIEAYVENLLMSRDEKTELKAYLEDYAEDLASQGKTKEEAVKIAIEQFRIQEFTSLSKNNSLLNLPIHYYLIGYTLIAAMAVMLLQLLASTIFPDFFLLSAVEFTFFSYGIGFIGLFFLYKLMDVILSKKISD